MTIGLIGKKMGMSQRFFENGEVVPVTILKIEKAKVVEIINKEKRGYSGILVGYGHIKNSKLTKQMKGFFSKKSQEPKKILKEFRIANQDQYKPGTEINLNILNFTTNLKYSFKNISKVMKKNPITIDKDTLAASALSIMTSKKITSLCVHKGKKNKKNNRLDTYA